MAKSPTITTAPTGNIAPFGLRMLPDLKTKVEQAAKSSGRSMNAEIVARIDASFSPLAPDARTLESLIDARVENAVKKALADYFDHLPKERLSALAKAVAKKD